MLNRRDQKLSTRFLQGSLLRISGALMLSSAAFGIAAPALHAQSASAETKAAPDGSLAYRMKKGDNLSLLAQRHMINVSAVKIVNA